MAAKNKNISGGAIARHRRAIKAPMTQFDLSLKARRFGARLDRAAIAKIENGIRGVLDFELVALSKALRVPMAKLVNAKRR